MSHLLCFSWLTLMSCSLQGGILEKYNVELIGAKLPSIDKAEDRELFKQVGSICRIHH